MYSMQKYTFPVHLKYQASVSSQHLVWTDVRIGNVIITNEHETSGGDKCSN